jgi:TIR domain
MPNHQPVVFLSHSHTDRHIATTLQSVLEEHGARTFLDQDQIQAGDVLPGRIRNGIESCNHFLLLWSFRAASSPWVRRELQIAQDLKKKIIPYKLDFTPLPAALRDLVFVEASDQLHAHAILLEAVLGSLPVDPTELFPGSWRAELIIGGVGQNNYDIELRKNGQVEGSARMQNAGVVVDLARLAGVEHVLATPIPVHGSWTYESTAKLLTLTLTAQGFGFMTTETIQIVATGRERGSIQGTDLAKRNWILTRLSPAPEGAASKPTETARKGSLQSDYDRLREIREPGQRAAAEFVFRAIVLGFARKGDSRLPPPSELEPLDFEDLVRVLAERGVIRT